MLPRGFGGWITGWMMPVFHDSIYKIISPVLKLKSDDYLLDVGCGSGQIAIPAAEAGVRVTGIDIAGNLIEHARRRAASAGLEARFDEGEMKIRRESV